MSDIAPNKTVWTYWSDDCPPVYDLCFETILRHNPTARVVNSADIKAMGGGEILDFCDGIPIPQKSDLIRFWLLYQHGGAWVDADCIAVAPLDLVKELDLYQIVGAYNPHARRELWAPGIFPCCFAVRKGSPIILEALDLCRKAIGKMKRGEHVPYGQTSVSILGQLWRRHRDSGKILRRQHWRYYPVPWNRAVPIFMAKARPEQHDGSPFWNPNAQLYHLTNRITAALLHKSREEILGGRTFVSFLFQKALGLSPAVPGRTVAILRRLPPGPVRVAEVGVMRAVNARCLLQQRQDLHLVCIDPWAHNPTPSYRTTKDYQLWIGPAKWERIYRQVRQRLIFAGDRAEFMRMISHEAAAAIPDGSLDLAFGDADHSYEGVREFLADYRPKIKPGGAIGVHDYAHPSETKRSRYGVKRAVDEFANNLRRPVETDKDWTAFLRL